jgi:hypothetical protein
MMEYIRQLWKWTRGIAMPRGRSTFNKRQKEQARQQKQREKAERRTQRSQEKPEGNEGAVDEMDELRKHAEEQAALFHVGSDEPNWLRPSKRTNDELYSPPRAQPVFLCAHRH